MPDLASQEKEGTYKINKLIHMKRLLIFLLLMTNAAILLSQNDTIPAKFNGSTNLNNFRNFLQHQLEYPYSAAENCEQGVIILGFQITSSGKIDSIVIINELTPALNLSAISSLRKTEALWAPASVNGKNINYSYLIQLIFRIEDSCKKIKYYVTKGSKYYKKMDYKNALENFVEVIRLDPFNKEILEKKIDCNRKLNMAIELEKDLKLMKYINTHTKI